MTRTTVPDRNFQQGFTLIALLVAVLVCAIMADRVVTVVSQQDQREREALLLRIGANYIKAIENFYESSPGAVKRWPKSLDELLDDRRFVTTRRHLRQLYPDPITRSGNWGIVYSQDGGITGVYSRSDELMIRNVSTTPGPSAVSQRYADLQFVYQPPLTPRSQ